MNCKQCNVGIEPPKKLFCSRACSGKWRSVNVYGDKYTNKYRALSPRNFLMCLCKKKKERRDLNVDDLMAIYNKQEGKCAISGRDMTYITGEGRVPTNMSLDRKIPSKGYILDNIQLVCIQANKMKMELNHSDLILWCRDILNTHKSKR